MSVLAPLARLFLAGVFLVAALGKLADIKGGRRGLESFGVPRRLASPLALLLPFAELAVAGLLLLGSTVRYGALAALGLLAVFTAAIVTNLARGRKPDCHCFGQLHSRPISWSTVIRNSVLAAIAALVAVTGSGTSYLALLGDGGASPAFHAMAAVALALAVFETWFILNLLPQQGRILSRLEKLETALGRGPGSGVPIGDPAPDFDLVSLTGERVSLKHLRSSGRPVLLFFSNPSCAPCDALLPELARWQRQHAEQITLAVITDGPIDLNRSKAEKHGLGTVLLQKDREVKEAYEVEGTPSAVLIAPDGRIASQNAYGEERVTALMTGALSGAALRRLDSGPTSHFAKAGASSTEKDLSVGQPVPSLVLPDLEGRPRALSDFSRSPTVVLFWSPSCGFCQQMLPELKAWERKRPAGARELLLISNGTVESNQAMGLSTPILLDPDGQAMNSFGASGTPMAVLINPDGRIASPIAVGSNAVMELARSQPNGTPQKRN
jgi:methylamine dehydrogenase accessory protein MauD